MNDHQQDAYPHDPNGYVHCSGCEIDPSLLFKNMGPHPYGLHAAIGDWIPMTSGPWVGIKRDNE